MSIDLSQNFTNFTKVIHRAPYPRISLSRPELTQVGKTVLVTGGATNIGFSIARSFLRANASNVVIIGRRQDVLDSAAEQLKAETIKAGTSTTVITHRCDQANRDSVKALWANLQDDGVFVDTLVLNAADFAEEQTLLELGAEKVWASYETNLGGPLNMVDGFNKQVGEKPKSIINVSTQAINMLYDSQLLPAARRPAYGLTKNAGTMLIQQIAKDVSPDDIQIVSFHPGLIHNDSWKKMGVKESDIPFDDFDLPGSFAVWATTKEASFLHGRFVWATWDIDEYFQGETRKRLEEEVDFLRIGVVGLNGALKA